jgi:hypothetical protein
MIVVSPIKSATAASATAKIIEYTIKLPRACILSIQLMSTGASLTPSTMATARNTIAFVDSKATEASETAPVCAIPVTTARITRPRMSSTTAAPRTTSAAASLSRPRSARTLAVMPTLVAVSVAPTKTDMRTE